MSGTVTLKKREMDLRKFAYHKIIQLAKKLYYPEDYMCADNIIIRDIRCHPDSNSDLEHIYYVVSSA